jgi:hypothetical protein
MPSASNRFDCMREACDSTMPKIYPLEEAAKLLGVTPKWLRDQLTKRRFAGMKRAGKWAMTEPQILSGIEMMCTDVRTPYPQAPDGLTRRSWLYHQRYPNGRHRDEGGGRVAVPAPRVQPLPSWYRRVHPEPSEVIAAMPDLTDTQRQFLHRVQNEGEVIVNGKSRRTVEALVRRGLVTYDGSYVLNEDTSSYIYRFTVRPTDGG